MVRSAHVCSTTTGAFCDARPAALAQRLTRTSPAAKGAVDATFRRPLLASARATAPAGVWPAIKKETLRGRAPAGSATVSKSVAAGAAHASGAPTVTRERADPGPGMNAKKLPAAPQSPASAAPGIVRTSGVKVKLMASVMLRAAIIPHASSEALRGSMYSPGVSEKPGAEASTVRVTSTAPGGAPGSVDGAKETSAAAGNASASTEGSIARLRGGAAPLAAATAAKKAVPGLLDEGARVHTRVPAEALRRSEQSCEPGDRTTPGAVGATTPMVTLRAIT